MSPRHLMLPVVAAGALVLSVSGCGGGDDSADTTTTGQAAEQATTTTSGDSSQESVISPECEDLRKAFMSLDVQQMLAAFTDGSNPGPQFQAYADASKAAEQNAPDEIAEDVTTMAEGYAALAASAGTIDWDAIKEGDQQASAAATEVMGGFGAGELADASDRVTAWLNDQCVPT